MSLKYKFKQWMDVFDSRSMSEKTLISVISVVVVVWIYSTFFLSPVSAEVDNLRRQLSTAETQLLAMEQREQLAITSSAEDPNQAVRLRIERAIENQAALQGEIQRLAGNLVTPQSMTRLLTSMLENQSGLNLVKVENREPLPMRSNEEPGVQAEQPGQQTQSAGTVIANANEQQVYKHSLVIELEGDYLSLIGYLRRIESFPERFFWDSISFVQVNWPMGRITLELHTLSTERGFVGV